MATQEETGLFRVNVPGVLFAELQIRDKHEIDAAIGILQYIRGVLEERKGELPAPVHEIQESDLLSLEDLGWS